MANPLVRAGILQMPPTNGVVDQAVREWMDSFANAWDTRNGAIPEAADQRFLTRADVDLAAFSAIARVFGGTDTLEAVGSVPTAAEVNATIAALQDEIRKSLIYQFLEQRIDSINLGAIEAAINDANGASVAAIANETQTRVSKDNALASAINTIWANVGGATAVIQDGQLASVNPSGASATKWTQVVASVTDPNTGLVNSTSIKQDLNVFASAANGTFNAIYSVRAQISVGGQTVVGGFGLSATSGAGSAQGGTIAFGVRADQFFIAATSATPDGTTQENQGNALPFMVLTVPQFVNGVLYPAGVFIKTATIGDATIGTAKIANLSVTNAKFGGDLYSDNWFPSGGNAGWYLQRSGNFYGLNAYLRGDITATSLTANTVFATNIVSDSLNQFFSTTAGQFNFTVGVGARAVRLTCTPGVYASGGSGGKDGSTDFANRAVFLTIDGSVQSSIVGSGSCYAFNISPGTHTLQVRNNDGAPGFGTLFTGRIYVDIIAR